MKRAKPSDLQLQVLSVLWRKGPATVRELLEAMPDGKKRAYTTLLSVLQVMEKKRLVTHVRRGQAHVYRAAVDREHVLRPMLRELTDNVFGGSPARALQFLLNDSDVDERELAEIRQLLRRLDPSGNGTAGEEGGS